MNKYREAKSRILNTLCRIVSFDTYDKQFKKDFQTLEELVEKATPKKPLEVFEFEFDVHLFGNCPICGEGCNSGMKYCGRCGQALDWSEEDDC